MSFCHVFFFFQAEDGIRDKLVTGADVCSSDLFELGARESFLLFNNVLLVIAAATVFAGTLAPLISDALKLGTVSVGPPYFNPTFMLSMLPLLALLSVGIHSNWKRGRLKDKQRTLLYTLIAAAVLACGLVFGDRKSTRLNSSHSQISYAVFCLKKKKKLYQ